MAKIEHYYTQFENDGIYHVYNRSVDRKLTFKSDENYRYIIRQFDKYLSDYLKIYACCLLGNHFHFMVKINNLRYLTNEPKTRDLTTYGKLSNQNNINEVPNPVKKHKTTHPIVSQQFKKLFQSYAMAFNKQLDRIGILFQTPFKRVKVDNENYLRKLAYYINTNAKKHKLVTDCKNWKWTYYNNLTVNKDFKLLKSELINYFLDDENFIFYHNEFATKRQNLERDFFIENE